MLSLGVLKMNKVWTALLVIGIVVSFLTGSIDKLGTVIVESATDAFNIFFKSSSPHSFLEWCFQYCHSIRID